MQRRLGIFSSTLPHGSLKACAMLQSILCILFKFSIDGDNSPSVAGVFPMPYSRIDQFT